MNAKRKGPEKPDKAVAAEEAADTDVGKALRSVYEKAIREDIPPEMLDLLGKLK